VTDDQHKALLKRIHVASTVAVLRAGGVEATMARAGEDEQRIVVDLLPAHDVRALWGLGSDDQEWWTWSLMDHQGQITAFGSSPLPADAHPDTVAEVIASYPYGVKAMEETDALRAVAVEILERYRDARVEALQEMDGDRPEDYEKLDREVTSYYVRLGLIAE
jgi:hypothetical protein